MTVPVAADPRFARQVLAACLAEAPLRLRVTGSCLSPLLREGETVVLERPAVRRARWGDVVLCETPSGLRLHRLVWSPPWGGWRTKGDRSAACDRVSRHDILGTVVALDGGRPVRRQRLRAVRSLAAAVVRRLLPA
jgi:hypothetical protein